MIQPKYNYKIWEISIDISVLLNVESICNFWQLSQQCSYGIFHMIQDPFQDDTLHFVAVFIQSPLIYRMAFQIFFVFHILIFLRVQTSCYAEYPLHFDVSSQLHSDYSFYQVLYNDDISLHYIYCIVSYIGQWFVFPVLLFFDKNQKDICIMQSLISLFAFIKDSV